MPTTHPCNLQQHHTHREAEHARRVRSAKRCTSSALGRNNQAAERGTALFRLPSPDQSAMKMKSA
eukprot:9633455-Alexandrium_andersonii.AAC.1